MSSRSEAETAPRAAALTGPASRAGVVLLLVLVASVLPALVLRATQLGTEASVVSHWLHAQTRGGDSWTPIHGALTYLDAHGPAGLYDATYFHSKSQFLYSPASLVLFRAARDLLRLDFGDVSGMNRLSWFVLPLMMALAFVALRSTLRAGEGTRTEHTRALMLCAAAALAGIGWYFPLVKGYELGQVQTWLSALVMVSIALWIADRRFAAGVAIGIFCTVKPHFGILLLWGLVRRETRFAAGMLTALAVLGLWSLAAFGLPIHLEYLALLRYLSTRGESFFANQSMNGLLHRLAFNGNNLEWDGTHTSVAFVPWIQWATTLFSVAVFAIAAWAKKSIDRDHALVDYSIALVAAILCSPVAYEHHHGFVVLVLLVAAAVWSRRFREARPALALLGVAYLLTANEFPFTARLADTHWNVVQSYMLFGTLTLFGTLVWMRKRLC